MSNEHVSDRLDEAINDLKALTNHTMELANRTSGNFQAANVEFKKLASQTKSNLLELHNLVNETNHRLSVESDTTSEELHDLWLRLSELEQELSESNDTDTSGNAQSFAGRIEYLESENYKWNHEEGDDSVELRLAALEEQNAYLTKKLEELVGGVKAAPVPVKEPLPKETPAKQQYAQDWFEGVWNGEPLKKH